MIGNKKDKKKRLDLGPIETIESNLDPYETIKSPGKPFDPMSMEGPGDGAVWNDLDPSKGPFVSEFTVVTEYDDYILCTYEAGDVFVAKPHTLRMSTYNGVIIGGKTFTRQDINQMLVEDVAAVESDEVWIITPDYEVGTKITAITVMTGIVIDSASYNETNWLEIDSPRTWAVVQ